MAKVFLKPSKPGTIVRDPVTYLPLKDEGEFKELNHYWRRRKKFDEVIEAQPLKAAKAAKQSTPAASAEPAVPKNTKQPNDQDKRGNE